MSARLAERSRSDVWFCVLASTILFTMTNGEQMKLSAADVCDGPVPAPTKRPEISHHFVGQLKGNIPFIPSDIKVDNICQ